MPVADPFDYSGRWGSVGLDCSNCQHFSGPARWPDAARELSCRLHNVSLAIELADSGYKEGEWFCREFANDGSALEAAQRSFGTLAASLAMGVLYRVNGPGTFLYEVPMRELPASAV